ncbi:MAG: hypothetical protein IJC52_02270, partial [Clostridia bacterium]|nr:hypothetical protein [Clostridia bacterium]
MKKFVITFFLVVMCLSLTACNNVKEDIVDTFCAIFSDREYTFYDDGTASYEALTVRGRHEVGEGTYEIKGDIITF